MNEQEQRARRNTQRIFLTENPVELAEAVLELKERVQSGQADAVAAARALSRIQFRLDALAIEVATAKSLIPRLDEIEERVQEVERWTARRTEDSSTFRGPLCQRCGHPSDWHRHDDATEDKSFRCLGYDCEADGPPPPSGRACICPDFVAPAPAADPTRIEGEDMPAGEIADNAEAAPRPSATPNEEWVERERKLFYKPHGGRVGSWPQREGAARKADAPADDGENGETRAATVRPPGDDRVESAVSSHETNECGTRGAGVASGPPLSAPAPSSPSVEVYESHQPWKTPDLVIPSPSEQESGREDEEKVRLLIEQFGGLKFRSSDDAAAAIVAALRRRRSMTRRAADNAPTAAPVNADTPWRSADLPDSNDWRERTTGNNLALARLEQIRVWVDRGWPRDVTNEQWTNLMIDLGEIRASLLAALGYTEPGK